MLQCLERDMFFTLDDDFPLQMTPPVDPKTQEPSEQFVFQGQANKSTGIMAIKYLITGGEGKECEFLDCGVILKGCCTAITHAVQKRVIMALLKSHVAQDFYNSKVQQGDPSSFVPHPAASSTSRVYRDGPWTEFSSELRVARRAGKAAGNRDYRFGFRICRSN